MNSLIIVAGALLAMLLIVPAIRRAVVTKPIFRAFKSALPTMSSTEREALEAGSTWWEAELFAGKPDWQRFNNIGSPSLTQQEQDFLDNETNTLCQLLDDWEITHEQKDLPKPVWDYIRNNGFFSLIIPEEFGGKAFSPYAQSCIVTRIATQSVTAAVTVMVPNSLGPGELLMHYGTQQQQQQWLPGLANGEHIPCFGLTGPEAGSDAGAIPDKGVVCFGEYNGTTQLGIRLNFSKRWITLAPVATVIGLAFKLSDPDGLLQREAKEYDITCALIPADHPGVEIGRRHYPGAFMNGPINGEDVFIPIDWIIGGRENAGKGWRMLMECLSAGRGISLPALGAAASKVAYQTTGAYGRIRRQFKTSVGHFEGVQEASARIAGLSYTLEASRQLVCAALHESTPPVVSAIAKYHMTEMMRSVVDDAMDIHGGRGVQMGPRNYLASIYQAVPIAITVEGANILTRSLMIFGQGAIRCHPYVLKEMQAAANSDFNAGLLEFDKAFWKHIGYTVSRSFRALRLGLLGARFSQTPKLKNQKDFKRSYQRINQYSTILAFTADIAMAVLGGNLKRKEMLSARLGDMLSQLFLATAVLKLHANNPAQGKENDAHAQWAVEHALKQTELAFIAFCDNFPQRWLGRLIKRIALPFGATIKAPADELITTLGAQIMQPSSLKDQICFPIYQTTDRNNPRGRVIDTYQQLVAVEKNYLRVLRAAQQGQLSGDNFDQQVDAAIAKGLVKKTQEAALKRYERDRYDCLLTDSFEAQLLSSNATTTPPKTSDRAA